MSAQPHRLMHALIHPRSATSVTAIGAVSVAFAAIVPWTLSESWWLEAGVALALAFAWLAAATDAETGRIPDRLVLLASVPTVAVMCLSVLSGHPDAVVRVVVGLIAFAAPLLVVHVVSPSALGFGDVKLAAALGAAIGLVDPRSAVLALCVASAATALVALARRRSAMAFGPGLVFGAAVSLVAFGASSGRPVPW